MRTPAAVVTHATSKTQSIELVRIIITTTFSHILWLRHMFPGLYFVFRTCDPADPNTSYDAFINGTQSTGTPAFKRTDNLESWAILPRHKNKDADKLLYCLENGVKEALENGSLSKLQLSLHTLDQSPPSTTNLIESYILGFDYKNGIRLAEITAENGDDIMKISSFSIGDVKTQMDYMLTQINHLLVNLNRSHRAKNLSLPKSFRMFLTMKYIGAEDYRPVGFHVGGDGLTALMEEAPLDSRLTMTTGHHSVFAGMVLPERLSTQESYKAQANLNAVETVLLKLPEVSRQATSARLRGTSEVLEGETQPQIVAQVETMGVSRIDDFDTQLVNSAPSLGRQSCPTVHYTQAVLDYVEQSQDYQKRGSDYQRLDKSNFCECQAGSQTFKSQELAAKDDTIKCRVCDGSRHLVCYGYLVSVQPEIFICYSCLKSQFPSHKLHLQEVESLCIKRQVLYHFLDERSPMHIKDIASYLDCSTRKASEILHLLKTETHLYQLPTGKHKAKLFMITGEISKVTEQYFNPGMGIEEFLEVYKDSPENDDEEIETENLEASPRQLAQSSKTSQRQPRIFHPSNVTITDDTSTQGTPSPHVSYSLALDPYAPATATGIGDECAEPEILLGAKRKADVELDVKSAKRVMRPRLSSGTPWSLKRP